MCVCVCVCVCVCCVSCVSCELLSISEPMVHYSYLTKISHFGESAIARILYVQTAVVQ